MWSVVEKTALAEAEVEYEDHTSTTVWVKFPVISAGPGLNPAVHQKKLVGASVIIWTTTPGRFLAIEPSAIRQKSNMACTKLRQLRLAIGRSRVDR